MQNMHAKPMREFFSRPSAIFLSAHLRT